MTTKKIATREAYGQALVEFAEQYEQAVVLDADLSLCTKTADFASQYPERYYNIGIAESNMIGIAAGLATCGKKAIANSFAMFIAGRAFEQIRNSVAYPNLDVIVVGTHSGLSVGQDGATHQCLEDLGIMRTIPNMTILCPADAVETRQALKAALDHKGPIYFRLSRLPVETVNDPESFRFELGKGVLHKEGKDLTIVTTGLMLQQALLAREVLLEEDRIETRIIHLHTIKPIDKEILITAAKETGLIITAENHNVMGGLGSAVTEILAEHCPVRVRRVGTQDVFGRSGDPQELMSRYGIDANGIVKVVREELAKGV